MTSRRKKQLTLQDIIRIVSLFARNEHETGLVVADLVNRGLIKIGGRYGHSRVVIR